MGRDIRSYAYQLAHATLLTEIVHLTVQFFAFHATLLDVTENKGGGLSVICRSSLHEIERDVKGVDIGIIGVINECTAMLSLLHLQTHGNRLEL